jgi:hypothetical protein
VRNRGFFQKSHYSTKVTSQPLLNVTYVPIGNFLNHTLGFLTFRKGAARNQAEQVSSRSFQKCFKAIGKDKVYNLECISHKLIDYTLKKLTSITGTDATSFSPMWRSPVVGSEWLDMIIKNWVHLKER